MSADMNSSDAVVSMVHDPFLNTDGACRYLGPTRRCGSDEEQGRLGPGGALCEDGALAPVGDPWPRPGVAVWTASHGEPIGGVQERSTSAIPATVISVRGFA